MRSRRLSSHRGEHVRVPGDLFSSFLLRSYIRFGYLKVAKRLIKAAIIELKHKW